jgi:hypothetical protein
MLLFLMVMVTVVQGLFLEACVGVVGDDWGGEVDTVDSTCRRGVGWVETTDHRPQTTDHGLVGMESAWHRHGGGAQKPGWFDNHAKVKIAMAKWPGEWAGSREGTWSWNRLYDFEA